MALEKSPDTQWEVNEAVRTLEHSIKSAASIRSTHRLGYEAG